jgi:hypothetical protein
MCNRLMSASRAVIRWSGESVSRCSSVRAEPDRSGLSGPRVQPLQGPIRVEASRSQPADPVCKSLNVRFGHVDVRCVHGVVSPGRECCRTVERTATGSNHRAAMRANPSSWRHGPTDVRSGDRPCADDCDTASPTRYRTRCACPRPAHEVDAAAIHRATCAPDPVVTSPRPEAVPFHSATTEERRPPCRLIHANLERDP